MLQVWVSKKKSGRLDRMGEYGTSFVYDAEARALHPVSVTMPWQTASWDTHFGLAPIFDMNMPEGHLRILIENNLRKSLGRSTALDLLAFVGRSQIGRLRYTPYGTDLDEDVPFQEMDEILSARRGGELYAYLLHTYAEHSGLAGVQPKVMVRTVQEDPPGHPPGVPRHQSVKGATHIVKFWEDEYPEQAANEYFCLTAAKAAGLSVPGFQLSEGGGALVIERFDIAEDGNYLGLEDMCVLNGVPTDRKYNGGYESKLFRRLESFLGPEHLREDMLSMFRLFVMNCALRNGDAHLKNWGILYDDPDNARLAPAYDIVTTTAYLPADTMALTLGGSTRWPGRKQLEQAASRYFSLTPAEFSDIADQAAAALSDTRPAMLQYFADTPNPEIGTAIAAAWEDGLRESLSREITAVQIKQVGSSEASPGDGLAEKFDFGAK